jgi:hypothetical protein
MKTGIRAALIGAASILAGCESSVEPKHQDQFSAIVRWQAAPAATTLMTAAAQPLELSATIIAPDTVMAGVSFGATISTIGLSGCWRAGGAEIATPSATLAVVLPFDAVEGGAGGEARFCTAALVDLPRVVTLRFDTPGTATIRVEGRFVVGEETVPGAAANVEKQIVVR